MWVRVKAFFQHVQKLGGSLLDLDCDSPPLATQEVKKKTCHHWEGWVDVDLKGTKTLNHCGGSFVKPAFGSLHPGQREMLVIFLKPVQLVNQHYIPIGSRYGLLTNHKNQPNVGEYTIHGSYGIATSVAVFYRSSTLRWVKVIFIVLPLAPPPCAEPFERHLGGWTLVLLEVVVAIDRWLLTGGKRRWCVESEVTSTISASRTVSLAKKEVWQ